MKNILICLLISVFAFGQTQNDTINRIAKIKVTQNGNTFNFSPEVPPLQQIAGAPKAFYTYYWEFDDGSYSTKENPTRQYKKQGDYEVKMWATNNYDSGKTPATRPQKITASASDDVSLNEENPMVGFLDLKRNREPLPDEEFVVILRYKNPKDYIANGKIYFYYNEKEFKNDNFQLEEIRNYHQEQISDTDIIAFANQKDDGNYSYASNENIPFFTQKLDTTKNHDLSLSIEEAKMKFKKSKQISFKNLQPNEQRNIFFTLKTTPEMIKDTSAILKVRSIYVPDDNYENHTIKDMEMEIVTSHDPNKMSTNGLFINYRKVRNKRVHFKTQFQNNGEGPARTIRLETDIPDMFDKTTLQIEKQYPECPICPKKEEVRYSCLDTIIAQKQIIFTYKNIYLPGSNQKNVTEYDSTKGFVKYSLKFGDNFHKTKTKSRTAIIFDKNEPIITNYSVTRFNPGISIGARAGYNIYPDLDDSKSYFAGVTISPYKSYKWYWQAELYFNRHTFSGKNQYSMSEITFTPPIDIDGITYDTGFEEISQSSEYIHNAIEVVPISIRHNLNNYIGFGFGPQLTTILSPKVENETSFRYFYVAQDGLGNPIPGAEITQLRRQNTSSQSHKTKVQTQLFADVTFGFARIGPSVGVRYLKNFSSDFDSIQLYAIWKF